MSKIYVDGCFLNILIALMIIEQIIALTHNWNSIVFLSILKNLIKFTIWVLWIQKFIQLQYKSKLHQVKVCSMKIDGKKWDFTTKFYQSKVYF